MFILIAVISAGIHFGRQYNGKDISVYVSAPSSVADGYEMIRVTATRVIKDDADTAIIEYNTERYIYESEESGKIIGYSLLETARLTIDGTGNELKLDFSPVEKTDCAAHEFLFTR